MNVVIAAIQRAMACRNCAVYLTVGDKTGLFARSRALITTEGMAFESVHYKVLGVTVELFDIKVEGRYPFDEARSGILAGHEGVFDIALDIMTPEGGVEGEIMRDCAPEAPRAWRAAGCRWRFRAYPSDRLWGIIIDDIWKDGV